MWVKFRNKAHTEFKEQLPEGKVLLGKKEDFEV